jgi:uncharacterized protein (DUF1499 family)
MRSAAHLSVIATGIALGAVLLGPLAAQMRLLSPYAAFRAFALGIFLGACGAFGFGLFHLIRTWSTNQAPDRILAWVGTLVGAALLLGLAMAGAKAAKIPPIHDITTNPDDPPALVAAAKHPDNQRRDLAYPHGDPKTAQRQRRAYPSLAPVSSPKAPAEALATAAQVAESLGWAVTEVDAVEGRLEATETSKLFRFVDDIVVRVRPRPEGGSIVDLRSTSRVGISDLGVNAERIRRFAEAFGKEP